MKKNRLNYGAFRSGLINYSWLAKAILFPMLLLAFTADAASFVPGERFSSIKIFHDEEWGELQSLSLDTNDHAVFNESLSASSLYGAELMASQISSVSAEEIHYQDSLVYNQPFSAYITAEAESEFTFDFEITSPSLFEWDLQAGAYRTERPLALDLSVSISKDEEPSYPDVPLYFGIDVWGLGPNVTPPIGYLADDLTYLDGLSYASSGVIEPGLYTLRIHNELRLSGGNNGLRGASSVEFNFALIPIPLPASFWLMMLGLGSLFGLQRINNKQLISRDGL